MDGWELTRPDAARKWWWIFYVKPRARISRQRSGGLVADWWIASWKVAASPKEFDFSHAAFCSGHDFDFGIVAAWGIPALIATNGEFLTVGIGHHVIFRSFGIMEGHGGKGWIQYVLLLPFFLVTFFFSFFPWSFRVPKTLWNWWPSRGGDTFGWYLLVQAALVFLTFTLVRTKLPHYTLPAFPFIAIWLARAIPGLKIFKWAAAMAIFIFVLTIGCFLAVKPEFASHQLFEKAKPYLIPGMKFAAIEYNEPSLVWEFRGIVTNDMQTLDAKSGRRFFRENNPSILIVPTGFATKPISCF